MERESDVKAFKMKKRQLSRFLCEEMLYDFASDKLDPERRRAVSEFLKESKECQDELESLYGGLEFAEKLSQAKVSDALYKKIVDAKTPLNYLISKYRWSTWPESIKWSVEAVGISLSVVLVFALLSPKITEWWPTAANQQLILAEADKSIPATSIPVEGAQLAMKDGEAAKAKEVIKEALADKPETTTVAANPPPPAPEPAPAAPAAPVAPPAPAPTPAPAKVTAKAPPQTDEEIAETKPTKAPDKGMRGVLFRAFMELDDLDVMTEKITADITSLGGEKAGEVPLGWRKPKGSYFHFTMPEENYEQLMNSLKAYGEVRLYKDPHPRVMPEGVIRLILSVEDASLKK